MIILLVALIWSITTGASERIMLFMSDITVQENTFIAVKETIEVYATGNTIVHGIVREFPTKYKDHWGHHYSVDFRVQEVSCNGHPEPYHISSVANGKKIYIGKKDVWVQPGKYTYTISYITNRQLGFFEHHDELYWNVTGNGWRLPIDKTIAIVHLPQAIARDSITFEGYTGYQSSKQQDYNAWLDTQGNVVFQSTRPFLPYEGLTIAVTWPKGFIKEPPWWHQWYWFFRDNRALLVALLGFFCLLGWYIYAWLQFRKTQRGATVIPLFYPPEHMTPGFMRYFVRMRYDEKVLAADIIAMAVAGLVTIEYGTKFFMGRYILHKKEDADSEKPMVYNLLLQSLFDTKKTSITLNKTHAPSINAAINIEKHVYKKEGRPYFLSAGWDIFIGSMIGLLFQVMLLACLDQDTTYIFIGSLSLYILLSIGVAFLLRGYTNKGLHVKKDIDGFKMFLIAIEQERLKIIGTPPSKTPELYEKYLPYAVALGVEQQWSRQFAPLFRQMKELGTPYVCSWMIGTDFDVNRFSTFVNNFSTNIESSIASASTPPGIRSGSGGSGSSGSGGGGGGGGGW